MQIRKDPPILPILLGIVLLAIGLTAIVALTGRAEVSSPSGFPVPVATATWALAPGDSPSPVRSPPPSSTAATPAAPAATHLPQPSPNPSATPAPSATPVPADPPPFPTPTTPAPALPAVFLDVPAYGQERRMSCEAATMRMLLGYYGLNLSEDDIQATFPITANPEVGFRGNVDGYTGFTDYGAHAPAVAAALQRLLDRAGLSYEATWQTFPSRDEAFAATHYLLSNNAPVIVWMTWYARYGQVPETREVNVPYPVTLIYAEHVEVVYGIEDRVMYVIDPYSYTKQDGRSVRTRPSGFRYTWKNGPPGWEYFDYAIVYLWPRPPQSLPLCEAPASSGGLVAQVWPNLLAWRRTWQPDAATP